MSRLRTSEPWSKSLEAGSNQADTEEEWLVVHRDVKHPSRRETLTVKVAYCIEADKEGRSIAALHRFATDCVLPNRERDGASAF